MKKILFAIILPVLLVASCQKPQYVRANANRQGITSISAIFTSGKYKDMELTKYAISEDEYESGYFVVEVPWFFPVTSEEETKMEMTRLRLQAELQPDFRISPKLGIVNLAQENWYTLTDPDGKSREICITGKRVKSSAGSIISLTITDLMISCVIYEDSRKIVVPYLSDLSSVSITGQLSPHATFSKVNGIKYTETGKYSMNTGATVTILAPDGKSEITYTVEQKMPEKIPSGFDPNSVSLLFNIDPVTMAGLPAYTGKDYVSIAAIGNYLVVSLGPDESGQPRTPVLLNRYNGMRMGELPAMGEAVADVIANDDAEHLLIANFAQGGDQEDVKLYKKVSADAAPVLLSSFKNPLDVPVGHRMKVYGNVENDAAIVLTAEGITGVTVTSKGILVIVRAGAVTSVEAIDMAKATGLAGWGPAPVHIATIAPASANPGEDGYYLDYYDDNSVDGSYALRYISSRKVGEETIWSNKIIDLLGNGNNNPNCLDCKRFNRSDFLALFVVSHFPLWSVAPRLYLFDSSSLDSPTRLFANEEVGMFQTGAFDGEWGASGDVCIAPSSDGYRMFIYYYDHHSQSIGGYVADCINR